MQGWCHLGVPMSRTGIISIDGHVAASRSGYRDYVASEFLDLFDDWVRAAGGKPEVGNVQPDLSPEVQWDSTLRLAALESQGVVAEVLFPNGMPFQSRRFEDASFQNNPAINREARCAYNRWLADFCSQAPGKRAGQAVITFDDIEEAVRDIYWAKEHGLGGVMMPALDPGGIFFFDPVLDPVWAACEEVGLPISQHGGAGSPQYDPPGYAAIMTLAMEQSFFAGRSLWQMILGGVFERFPKLQIVFVETGADWIAPAIRQIDRRMATADDWAGFAVFMQRAPQFTRTASEQWATNCHAGVSPFAPTQLDFAGLQVDGADRNNLFTVTADKTMFGVDFPHFESINPHTVPRVAELLAQPGVGMGDVRNILCNNAAAVYGFDLDALQPDIDRIGIDLAELATSAH